MNSNDPRVRSRTGAELGGFRKNLQARCLRTDCQMLKGGRWGNLSCQCICSCNFFVFDHGGYDGLFCCCSCCMWLVSFSFLLWFCGVEGYLLPTVSRGLSFVAFDSINDKCFECSDPNRWTWGQLLRNLQNMMKIDQARIISQVISQIISHIINMCSHKP